MGYDLHIVRRDDWDDSEADSNISLAEWLLYVESDHELELTNGYQIKIPGVESSFQHVPGFCYWKGHPAKVADDKPWFDYGHGMISTKYPDDETIKKMIAIAAYFQGRVQGDDGEFYDETYLLEKAGQAIPETTNRTGKKPWWRFW
ncbi:hypothetical protein [Filimonas effusa]|uniref:Uncharacterized protein n=1 Tax=Filimonas effusa TaxID=2508721 RepID=A0A4Q1DC17_9BACT|nr:hypothetical protein [Filimonas effusa]RXK86880.1 hypothetical protein ESB13_08850 [Filimonas effusa]